MTRAAVVGAGIVGLSTAYALMERGVSVRVFEQGVPGNGQSGGESRIFRHAHDDRRLVRAAQESRAVYDEWAATLGVELVSDDGAVAIGPSVDKRLPLLIELGVTARRIGPEELAERLPVLAGYDGPAMLDERGGSIRTTAAVRALAAALGDRLVADEVLSIRPVADGVEVRSGGSTEIFDRVVLCAGRGTAPLARTVGLSGATAVREDGSLLAPDELADLAGRAASYVARALPGLDPEPVDVRHCWVTELPWSEDGLAVWETDGILFPTGHNLFKQAPGLGRRLAAAVDGEPLADDLRPESLLGAP